MVFAKAFFIKIDPFLDMDGIFKKRKDGQDISFDDITDKLDDLEMAINELSDRVEDKGDELNAKLDEIADLLREI